MGCCVCSDEFYLPDWKRWSDHPAREQWTVLKDLGSGAFADVVLAQHVETQEIAALKVVHLHAPESLQDPEHIEIMLKEAKYLAMCHHPGIVEYRDVIRNSKHLVIVEEWLQGGLLMDELPGLGASYSEAQAAEICAQLASALSHLHSHRILHRDLKPENIMFRVPVSMTSGSRATTGVSVAELQKSGWQAMNRLRAATVPPVVIIDLGMAALYNPEEPITGPLGSAGFVAPEIIVGGVHTPAMDVFSLGVLMFILLVGRKPFNVEETSNLSYGKINLMDAPGFEDARWKALSIDAKHLLLQMMHYDPKKRLTACSVTQHPWVTSRGGTSPRTLGHNVSYGAATVGSLRRLKNMTNGVMVLQRAAELQMDDSARRKFLERMQRTADLGVKEGFMERSARRLAAKSYGKLHDSGRAILPDQDISRHFSSHRGGSFTSLSSTLGASSYKSDMPRSNTTLMLSEMDRSYHHYNDSHQDMRRTESFTNLGGSTKGLHLLANSFRLALDVSRHGPSIHGAAHFGAVGEATLNDVGDCDEDCESSTNSNKIGSKTKLGQGGAPATTPFRRSISSYDDSERPLHIVRRGDGSGHKARGEEKSDVSVSNDSSTRKVFKLQPL